MSTVRLSGLYAFTFQCLIHAQDIDTQKYHWPLDDVVGLGGVEEGSKKKFPDGYEWAPRPTKETELPAITAFYHSQYGDPPPPFPAPIWGQPDKEGDPPPVIDYAPLDKLPEGTQEYVPNTGYYPFTYAGWMKFDDVGGVEGALRLNLAGFSVSASVLTFKGVYRLGGFGGFSPSPQMWPGPISPGVSPSPQMWPKPIPAGIITTKWDYDPNVLWDYHFFVVSKDEIQLMALGRKPYPGTGTGTMKRVKWDEIVFIEG